MKNILISSLLLLVFSSNTIADDLQWSWTAPVARTDGTSFDMATEGAGYRVWFNDVLESIMLSAGSNALTKVFPAGQVCAKFATVDIDGREGPQSAPVCKDVFAPPGAPSNVTVTIIVP